MMDKNTNAADNKVTPEIDVDKIIEQLLSVKEFPGKQYLEQGDSGEQFSAIMALLFPFLMPAGASFIPLCSWNYWFLYTGPISMWLVWQGYSEVYFILDIMVQLPETQIRQLCILSRQKFLDQSNLLELECPVNICGDVHGQFDDLIKTFEQNGYPPDKNYLFLGDYVDRGKRSLESICLLLAYKVKYPDNFFLLRGNHECASINRIYGFYDECKRRYNIKLWKTFTDCFNCLPIAAVVEDTILCMHGGLSPHLNHLDQIRGMERPMDVPDQGLVCDMLWSDPDEDITGWGENDRGVSFTFGGDIVKDFCKKHDLSLICRAHQVVEDGYQFFQKRQLVTIFGAPNYCGEFDNAAATMIVSDDLTCSFTILKPQLKKLIVDEKSDKKKKK